MNSATAIQTFTGIFFDPFEPDPELIRIEDIAHALAMQCRFGGHIRKRWSVAQHSMMVSDLCPADLKLHGLLHDASEAYLVDLPRPIKHAPEMKFYRVLESRVETAIALRFGLSINMPDEVKRADQAILGAEARALKQGLDGWLQHAGAWELEGIERGVDPTLVNAIRNATPPSDEYIRDEFLRTFSELGGR
jgi:5'-deoxynucleotidase YfbR-like HD superfamily hydrolase